MRIGIFLDAYKPYISGVVTSVGMLEEGLKKLGHEVFIFTVNLEGKETLFKDNIVYFKGRKVPIKSLSNYKLVFGKRKKIKFINTYNLDIIHVHNEFSLGRIGLKFSKKYKIPMIYTFHTLYEEYLGYLSPFLNRYFHRLLMKVFKTRTQPLAKQAKCTILPTTKVSEFAKRYGIKGKTAIIPTGINLEKFQENDLEFIKETKEKYNITNEFILLSLGRVSEEKSLDVIAYAFKKVNKDINAKLVIVGDGPYFNKIVELINSLELQNDVIFTKGVSWDLVQKYYHLGDLMLNASKSETQGLTNIEALASGKPLLVQADDAINELITDGFNGFKFDGIDDLANKMVELYFKKENLKKMKENCINSVDKYSNLEYARRVLKIYEEYVKA